MEVGGQKSYIAFMPIACARGGRCYEPALNTKTVIFPPPLPPGSSATVQLPAMSFPQCRT